MGAQTVEYAARRPSAALRGLVDTYVGYRLAGVPPGVHRGLPSRHLTLVLTFDAPLRLGRPGSSADAARFGESYSAVVGGLHAAPVLISHDGLQYGVQLSVTPRGARALLGVPAGELGGVDVPLDAVLGGRAAELTERLAAADGWGPRFDVLDQTLSRLLRESPAPHPEIDYAWRRLVATVGGAPVAQVAAEVGWSRRHLAERFRREIGLSPKVVARVLRFERARAALLRPGAPPRLADVAIACGFADQAHLTREWRELAGCTPSVWLAEEAPYLHAEPADGPEFPFVQDGRQPSRAG